MLNRLGGDFLQWLRGFYYVVTLGGISAAAQQMGLRQPTVSHQIRMLEEELGVQLFQRAPRKMIPTREGLALYERAIGIFEQIRGIKAEVGRQEASEVKGEIQLITTHSVACNILPELIRSFREENPETFFSITAVTETGVIVSNVLSSSIEMGIGLGHSFPQAIEAEPLFTSPLVLIVSREHARRNGWRFTLDKQGNLVDLKDLAAVPYVEFSPGTSLTHYLHTIFASNHMAVRSHVTVNTSTLVVRFVEQGFGVSIIDEFTAATALSRDLLDIYPLACIPTLRPYHLITRKKSYLSPQAMAFRQHLRQKPIDLEGARARVSNTPSRSQLS